MDMEARMTLCNMSIEAGARCGMVAPDATTFEWLRRAPRAPKGAAFEAAMIEWSKFVSDADAEFDRVVRIDAADIRPTLTWGTHPGTAIAVDAVVPEPADASARKGLDYMGFEAGFGLVGQPVDVVFVGSCTNGRLADLRDVAKILSGRRVHPRVRMLDIVAPGQLAVSTSNRNFEGRQGQGARTVLASPLSAAAAAVAGRIADPREFLTATAEVA